MARSPSPSFPFFLIFLSSPSPTYCNNASPVLYNRQLFFFWRRQKKGQGLTITSTAITWKTTTDGGKERRIRKKQGGGGGKSRAREERLWGGERGKENGGQEPKQEREYERVSEWARFEGDWNHFLCHWERQSTSHYIPSFRVCFLLLDADPWADPTIVVGSSPLFPPSCSLSGPPRVFFLLPACNFGCSGSLSSLRSTNWTREKVQLPRFALTQQKAKKK